MGIVLIIIIGIIYLIPTLVAINNKKANAGAIAVLNIFLGWVFIPWVIALVWACTKNKEPDIVRVFEENHPHTLGYVKK